MAIGFQSLFSSVTGNHNTASGFESLFHNTTGDDNAATGYEALFNNSTGTQNVAMGYQSLFNNATGTGNVGIGYKAGLQSSAVGDSDMVYLGNLATRTSGGGLLSNGIAIGYKALVPMR